MTSSIRLTCAAALTSLVVALAVPAAADAPSTATPEPTTTTTTTTTATAVPTEEEPTKDAQGSSSGSSTAPDTLTPKDPKELPEVVSPADAPDFLNDPECVPAPEHPTPVLFLHGTSRNMSDFYATAESLHKEGFCVWGYNYGKNTGVSIQNLSPSMYATGDIPTSVAEVSRYIDHVLEETEAPKLDIVGHSQGGMIPKAYIATYGAEKVNRVVSMGAPFHGTEVNGHGSIVRGLINFAPHIMTFFLSPASSQQIVGSNFIAWLNKQPDTVAGVTYTSFYSPDDTVVTPNETSKLTAVDGADVANVDVKDVCAFKNDQIIHDDLPLSPTMASLIYWSLSRSAEDTTPPTTACTYLPNDDLTWYPAVSLSS